MIVKGLVTPAVLHLLRQTIALHGLREGVENEFRTWRETVEGDRLLWVELDVNEDLTVYLYRTGFFDPDQPQTLRTLKCPHCGNADPTRMELHRDKTGWTHHALQQDRQGEWFAHRTPQAEIFSSSARSGTRLFCQNCRTAFADPGLPLRDSRE